MNASTLSFVVAILFTNSIAFSDVIILRDGRDPVHGAILSGGETGLRIEFSNGTCDTDLIPWSVIQEIQSDRPLPSMQVFLLQGTELYRAKQRLLRGDVVLAEPLFLKSFIKLAGTDCDDARLASEGLLRCAVSRGDFELAVHPWLETVRLDEMNIPQPFQHLTPILDPSTLLCPHLPPVWLNNDDLVQICDQYRRLPQTITSAIASSLMPSASELKPIAGVQDPTFLIEIIRCSQGSIVARQSLIQRQKKFSPWKQAWANYFIGKGLLDETESDSRTSGLIFLAKVASINPKMQPWICCASMLILSDAMDVDGNQETSIRIRDEAIRLFPSHPLHIQDQFQIRSSNK